MDPYDEKSEEKASLAEAKLRIICSSAREVLLSYVKKDVNLATYPGGIQLPASLFQRKPPVAKLRLDSSIRDHQDAMPDSTLDPADAHHHSDSRMSSRGRGKKSVRRSGGSGDLSRRSTEASWPNMPKPLNTSGAAKKFGSEDYSFQDEATNKFDSQEQVSRATRKSQRIRNSQESISSSRNDQPLSQETRTITRVSRDSLDSENTYNSVDRNSRVHFSPELSIRKIPADMYENDNDHFGGISPIQAAASPIIEDQSGKDVLSSGEKTRGTTPPSALRGASISATSSPAIEGSARVDYFSKTSNSELGKDRVAVFIDHKLSASTHSTDQSSAASHLKSSLRKKRSSQGIVAMETSKRRKESVPVQIKIPRHKSDKENHVQHSRQADSSSRSKGDNASLDFLDSDDEEAANKKASRGSKSKNRLKGKKGSSVLKRSGRQPIRRRRI